MSTRSAVTTRTRQRAAVGAVALAALVLAGCAEPGPRRAAPALPMLSGAGVSHATDPIVQAWPAQQWWTVYGDAALDRLIDQALAGQPSLQIAQSRLAQAAAATEAAQGARLPQVQGSLDMTNQRFTENGPYPRPLAGSTRWNNSLQVGASWDLDLFGGKRAAVQAAVGREKVAQAEVQAARTALASQLVQGWIELARLRAQRALAAQTLAARERQIDLVAQRVKAGLDTQIERHQAGASVAQQRAEIEALDDGIARAQRALAELAGLEPTALQDLKPDLARLPQRSLPATLPADLLGRRADLVAQRWRIEAAGYEVDSARAQFYPNVNLVSFAGLASLGLTNFIDLGSRQYGAGPAIRLPIFEGGRLKANLQAHEADVDAAVQGYRATLLRAAREVADETGSLQALDRQQAAQSIAVQDALRAEDLATQRYRGELGSYLQVLSAHQAALVAQRAAVDLKARRLAADAALMRALGGGYEARPDDLPPSAATTRGGQGPTDPASAGIAANRS